MPKAYSGDLRVRVIEMVRAGASRRGRYPGADAPPAAGSNARARSVVRPDAPFYLGR